VINCNYYAAEFVGALAASLMLTPIIRNIARRIGFVDRPDGRRKLQSKVIALGGGVAVLIALVATSIAVVGVAVASRVVPLGEQSTFLIGLLIALVLLAVVGLIDDSVGIRGRYKLAGQIAAALVLVAFGLDVPSLSVLHLHFDLGWFGILFTVLWLVGSINAINLLDGADGLASSVGCLLCLTVATLAGLNDHPGDSLVAVGLAGALLGFLRYNFAPASIYLGDTGSMCIGLVLGATSIHSHIKGSASPALFVPMCLLAIPIFDSAAALIRRKLTGRSLFIADRGHFHHLLLQRGHTVPRTVFIICGICLVTCLGALAGTYFRNEFVAVATMVFVLAALIYCRIFGHIEFGLITHRSFSVLPSLFERRGSKSQGPVVRAHHVQGSCKCDHAPGSCKWHRLWTALAEFAEDKELSRMELTVSIPAISELFNAVWTQPDHSVEEHHWKMEIPLFVDGRRAGHLAVNGHADKSAIKQYSQLVEFLEPLESQIKDVVQPVISARILPLQPVSGNSGGAGVEVADDAPLALATARSTRRSKRARQARA
jgi:UDP-GlcNAc:undecaprenyl-phosphate GlcNAc-1-phosphate transferase